MAQFAFPVIQYATSQANVVLAHLAAGGRDVMMAHGVSKAFADRFMVGGAVVAGLVATLSCSVCAECASSLSEFRDASHRRGKNRARY